jgi:hypothetical protein
MTINVNKDENVVTAENSTMRSETSRDVEAKTEGRVRRPPEIVQAKIVMVAESLDVVVAMILNDVDAAESVTGKGGNTLYLSPFIGKAGFEILRKFNRSSLETGAVGRVQGKRLK